MSDRPECCVFNSDGSECARPVEHSAAFSSPEGTMRLYFCAWHWDTGARDAMRSAAAALEATSCRVALEATDHE